MGAYNSLKTAYYEKLNELGIEYLETNEMDSTPEYRVFDTTVADQYANPTVEEMCDVLDMNDWVKAWAIDVINSEKNTVEKFTNNFRSEAK